MEGWSLKKSTVELSTDGTKKSTVDKIDTCATIRDLFPTAVNPTATSTPAVSPSISQSSTVKRKRKTPPKHRSVPSKQSKIDDFYITAAKKNPVHLKSASSSSSSEGEQFASLHSQVSAVSVGTLPPTMPYHYSEMGTSNDNVSLNEHLTRMEENTKTEFEKLSNLIKTSIENTNKMRKELNDYKTEISETVDNLDRKVSSKHEELKAEQTKFQKQVNDRFASLTAGVGQGDQQANLVTSLQNRIDMLERESKKMNLVIKGLQSTSASADFDARDFLENAFNLTSVISEVRYIPLKGKFPNRIVIQLNSRDIRGKILSEKRSLAANPAFKNIYIEWDLTTHERWIAGKIREKAHAAKTGGKNVSYTSNRLTIDNVSYRWDESTQGLKPWSPRREPVSASGIHTSPSRVQSSPPKK